MSKLIHRFEILKGYVDNEIDVEPLYPIGVEINDSEIQTNDEEPLYPIGVED